MNYFGWHFCAIFQQTKTTDEKESSLSWCVSVLYHRTGFNCVI